MISLGEFLSSNTADFFPSDKVGKCVNDRFRTKTEGTLERFKNGDYGGRSVSAAVDCCWRVSRVIAGGPGWALGARVTARRRPVIIIGVINNR
jgi:hypothetical protein